MFFLLNEACDNRIKLFFYFIGDHFKNANIICNLIKEIVRTEKGSLYKILKQLRDNFHVRAATRICCKKYLEI